MPLGQARVHSRDSRPEALRLTAGAEGLAGPAAGDRRVALPRVVRGTGVRFRRRVRRALAVHGSTFRPMRGSLRWSRSCTENGGRSRQMHEAVDFASFPRAWQRQKEPASFPIALRGIVHGWDGDGQIVASIAQLKVAIGELAKKVRTGNRTWPVFPTGD